MIFLLRWLKKKELEKIEELETVQKQHEEIIQTLDARLSDAVKIANKKKTIACYNKKCMDYDPETGGCCLSKVIVTIGGRCEDYDDGSAMRELEEENKNKLKVFVDGKPFTVVG